MHLYYTRYGRGYQYFQGFRAFFNCYKQTLLKALYLATFGATKKWTMPIRNWGKVYGEMAIMYEGRMPE